MQVIRDLDNGLPAFETVEQVCIDGPGGQRAQAGQPRAALVMEEVLADQPAVRPGGPGRPSVLGDQPALVGPPQGGRYIALSGLAP
jgi:hypothetical protein